MQYLSTFLQHYLKVPSSSQITILFVFQFVIFLWWIFSRGGLERKNANKSRFSALEDLYSPALGYIQSFYIGMMSTNEFRTVFRDLLIRNRSKALSLGLRCQLDEWLKHQRCTGSDMGELVYRLEVEYELTWSRLYENDPSKVWWGEIVSWFIRAVLGLVSIFAVLTIGSLLISAYFYMFLRYPIILLVIVLVAVPVAIIVAIIAYRKRSKKRENKIKDKIRELEEIHNGTVTLR